MKREPVSWSCSSAADIVPELRKIAWKDFRVVKRNGESVSDSDVAAAVERTARRAHANGSRGYRPEYVRFILDFGDYLKELDPIRDRSIMSMTIRLAIYATYESPSRRTCRVEVQEGYFDRRWMPQNIYETIATIPEMFVNEEA